MPKHKPFFPLGESEGDLSLRAHREKVAEMKPKDRPQRMPRDVESAFIGNLHSQYRPAMIERGLCA